MRTWIVATALAGCGQEYALSNLEAPPPAPLRAAAVRGEEPVPAPKAEPFPAKIDVVLGGDAPAAVVDYLFVIDGSASMQRVIDRVLDGVDAVATEGGVFPADARIAVMGTTPSHPRRRDRLHPVVPNHDWLALDPAFGRPVDALRIERFRREAPEEWAEKYALDGCSAWFAPGDRSPSGVPCLVAHSQPLLFGWGVEAGLTALGQRLTEDEPLFRPGAAVNVIFVSDTHDPGIPSDKPAYEDLVAIRPSFEALQAMADLHHTLASFRVHAIAPAKRCAGEKWTDPVYFTAAEDSGGRTLDICTAEPEDYVAMVRGMVESGAVPQRPVVALNERAEAAEVLVDGVPVASRLSRDGRAVVLDALPSAPRNVSVRYRKASGGR